MQFDYNLIRDHRKQQVHVLQLLTKQFIGQYLMQLPQKIQIPKSIL